MAEEAGLGLSDRPRRPAFFIRVSPARWARLAAALACALLAAGALAGSPKKNPSWSDLTPAQQHILAPLAAEWNKLDVGSKNAWLRVAKRYPKMAPIGQKRVQTRMKKWATLTPEQRHEARERYRKLTPQKRRELERKWAEYQALPPQERARLEAPAAAPPAANHAAPQTSPTPGSKGK